MRNKYKNQVHLRHSYKMSYKLNYYQRKFEIKLSLIWAASLSITILGKKWNPNLDPAWAVTKKVKLNYPK